MNIKGKKKKSSLYKKSFEIYENRKFLKLLSLVKLAQ